MATERVETTIPPLLIRPSERQDCWRCRLENSGRLRTAARSRPFAAADLSATTPRTCAPGLNSRKVGPGDERKLRAATGASPRGPKPH